MNEKKNTSVNENAPVKEKTRIEKLRGGLDAFGNIFGLNICFLVACLPIITIGASLTALYSMCIRLQEDEEEVIFFGFIHEFKRSFVQATKTWLLVMFAFAVMFAELLLVMNFKGLISILYLVVLCVEFMFTVLTLPFLFPLIARYNNDFWSTLKNSFLLAIGYFGSWIKITVAWVAPFAFTFMIEPLIFLLTWYLWILFIPALIAYGTSFTVRKVFRVNAERVENTKKEIEKKQEEAVDTDEVVEENVSEE